MAKGRGSKPISLVKGHRSKAEIKVREEAESKLYTGFSFTENAEVKNNVIAHKEFLRVKKLLKAIGKDDDLCGQVINMHCLLTAECIQIEKIKEIFTKNLEEFEEKIHDEEMTFKEQIKLRVKLQSQIIECDRMLMTKRRMLIDIAKENLFTLASQLRGIPKKPEKQEEVDPMESLIRGG